MVTKRYYNLTGGLNTSYGLGTINQGTNRTESPEMVNVEYYKLSGLQTMAGNTQFGSTLDSKITLGYEYILEDESYMIVCTSNGGVYEYNKLSSNFVKIYQFTTPTPRHSIASFNYGVIISNGVDDLVYYKKNRKKLLTGEVSTTQGTSEVVGTETKFKTEVFVGDRIQIGDNLYYIEEITDDTHLTIVEVAAATVENVDFYISDISRCNAVLINSSDANISIPIRGLALASYRGRLWVGDREGRLFYSEVGNIHGWDIKYGAGAFDSFFEDNTDFVALGLWAEYLVAHKRERTYLIDASADSTSNWIVKQYSEYTCDSQQSFVVANNGYYIFSREAGGIYPMLSRSLYSVLYQAKESSIKIHDSFDIINTAKFNEIYSVYHPSKKYIMFYIPMLNGIGSNECYILDIQTNSWLHRQVPQEVTCAFQYKDQVYIGTAQGKVLKEFSGRSFDGEKINFSWKSPWFTWGGGTDWTTTREARFKISEEGASKFHVRTLRDGSSEFKSRIINNDNPNLDSLVWDIGYQAGDETVKATQTETVPVYKYTTSNNYIYYSLVNSEIARTVPIKLFYSEDITGDYTYSTLVTELVEGSEEDNNFVVFEPQNVYAWGRLSEPIPSIYGYKMDGATEPYYTFVDKNIKTSGKSNVLKQLNNIESNWYYKVPAVSDEIKKLNTESLPEQKVPDNTTIWYPFYSTDINGNAILRLHYDIYSIKYDGTKYYTGFDIHFGDKYLRISGNAPNSYVRLTYGSSTIQLNDNTKENNNGFQPTWTSTNYIGYVTLTIKKNKIIVSEDANGVIGEFTAESDFTGEISLSQAGFGNRKGNSYIYLDSGLSTETFVYDGTTTYNTATNTVQVSDFTGETITSQGVTWTRDKTKDGKFDPNDMDKIVFTKESAPTVGTEFYYDRDFTRSYQFVKAVIDTSQVTMDNNDVLSRASSLDTVNELPHFYKSQVVEYTNNGEVKQIPNKDYYNYPEPTTDTLTDTVWDEYAWVKTGHITRRILLPNQYFQSLQFEFFGDALDENMYLYGFEVDGIQLTEHPY